MPDGIVSKPTPAMEAIAAAPKYSYATNKVQRAIRHECHVIADFLVGKNQKYGNSALELVRIFSKASPEEAIRVRLDDKLSRLKRCPEGLDDEDTILDLIGYLILLRVSKRVEETQHENGRSAPSS